ncbi:MAG TPA: hypothetical protein VGH83_01545 [Candidatus Acidoferrum sp.]
MPYSRRTMMLTLVGGAGALAAGSALYPFPQRNTPQPIPSPNAPNPNFPPGMNGPDITPPDQKKMNKQAQADVKADVEKLYVLITDLREQVQRSDVSATLSLSVVKKAQQIEKLAKQVKERAKG